MIGAQRHVLERLALHVGNRRERLAEPPVAEGADFSVIIMEQDEYVPMCGHCMIGTATTVLANGMVKAVEPVTTVTFETPGGIVRCDRVAQGVVDAYKNIGNIQVPIIVRLQGTNAVEAKKLIDDSGLKVLSAVALQEAADRVKQVLA